MNDLTPHPGRQRLFVSLALMVFALLLFSYLQNQGNLIGGKIATAKLLWLFYAIFYWFILPVLILLDGRCSAGLHRIYTLFLANMCARALIELTMMYITLNWHPYYGIGHDLFSLILLIYLVSVYRSTSKIDRLLVYNLWIISAMLLLESGFAWYLLRYVGDKTKPIYFVPANAGHDNVILVTWCAVLLLSGYLIWLIRRWLYATSKH